MIEIYNLTDPFRELYPDPKRYTWRKRTPLKQARLDFFLISQSFNYQVHDVKIINSYRSDYCPITLQLKLNDFILGMGIWKFMLKLLKKLLKKLTNSMLHQFDDLGIHLTIMLKLLKKLLKKPNEQYAALV